MAKKNKGGKKGASTAAVALLKETKTPFEIREYEHVEGETSFGLEAAQKLGANPEQVFKTLLIVHDKDFAVGGSASERAAKLESGGTRPWLEECLYVRSEGLPSAALDMWWVVFRR